MIVPNQQVLGQAVRLVRQLDDHQYGSPRTPWSSVGAHLRHVIEHYQCFLEGLPDGRIDYDARRRDSGIESSRDYALGILAGLIEGLEAVPDAGARTVEVQMACEADAPDPLWTRSTVGRELQFLLSHAVHHYALIRMLLTGEGVSLDEDFGTAPSTIAHTRRHGTCAP